MDNRIIAICNLESSCHSHIRGHIRFKEIDNDLVEVKVRLKGLEPGFHGFHIHEAGDTRDKCNGACKHFNPFGTFHGGPTSSIRHVGDLGNIRANKDGIVKDKFTDHMIKLRGELSIIGRSVVIHEDIDDLGQGGVDKYGVVTDMDKRKESLKTGNAGKRIACGVIGYHRKMF